MAVEEENDKEKEAKGFAGLSSLVSDVDTTSQSPAPRTEHNGPTARGATLPHQAQPQQSAHHQTSQGHPQPSSDSSGGKWVLGIGAVLGLFWVIGLAINNSHSPAPAYSPLSQSAAPNYSRPTQEKSLSRLQESKPALGRDLVLSAAQIRYCLAEDIRIDAAKGALDNYIDSDVDRFNAMVADYNSRCGSFRYRRGALESARRDVDTGASFWRTAGVDSFRARPRVPCPRRQKLLPYRILSFVRSNKSSTR